MEMGNIGLIIFRVGRTTDKWLLAASIVGVAYVCFVCVVY